MSLHILSSVNLCRYPMSSDLALTLSHVFIITISIISAYHPWQILFTNIPILFLSSTRRYSTSRPLWKGRTVLWLALANESWTEMTCVAPGLWPFRNNTWANTVFFLPQWLESSVKIELSAWVPEWPQWIELPSQLTQNMQNTKN